MESVEERLRFIAKIAISMNKKRARGTSFRSRKNQYNTVLIKKLYAKQYFWIL